MSRAPLLLDIDKEFNDKFSTLRLGELSLNKETKQGKIVFYYVEPFFDEDKKELSEFVLRKLPQTFSYAISFIRNYFDDDVIIRHCKKFISENNPFLYTSINDDSISINSSGEIIQVRLNLDSSSLEQFKSNDSAKKMGEYLSDRFPVLFRIDTYDTGEIDRSGDFDRLDSKKEQSYVNIHSFKNRVIPIEPTEEFIGRLIEYLPNYISDFVEPKDDVCICGTVENCIDRVSKNGLSFKTFTLNDNTGIINAIVFDSKTNPKNKLGFTKIVNGISIVVIGKLENDKFGKGLQLICNAVSRCYIPKDFVVEKKISKPAPFYYLTVKPQKYIEEIQVNLFDNDKPLPEEYQNKTFVCFDVETTGLDANDQIIDIGAYKIENGVITESFNSFVNPNRSIPKEITELTGITNEDVKNAPFIKDVIADFYKFTQNSVLVAHNIGFDIGYIKRAGNDAEYYFYNDLMDTLALSTKNLPMLHNHKLNTVAEYLNIKLVNHHRASDDALACAKIFLKILKN